MSENINKNIKIKPSFFMAILPILLTLSLLAIQLFYYGDFTPHIPLAIGIAITATLGWFRGYSWNDMEDGVMHVVRVGLPSIAILMTVGMIVGVWIASVTVPVIIYYGLNVLNPEVFLAAAMVLCAVVSVSLGTSWGTTGTVGLALMGIGSGFDIPMYWTAGAVVSGAFFGDKISPLSDTTNLAPAVTGVNLFDHIRNMMPTTVPAMLIALVIYLFVGFNLIESREVDFSKIEAITHGLESKFNLTLFVLLPPLLVIGLALKKMPALPSLFAGVTFGAFIAIFVQGASLHEVFNFMQSGYVIETGVNEIDVLLNRGGIQSMTWVITLVIIALGFGGALERTHCLDKIIEVLLSRVNSFFGLQVAATSTAVATNLVAGDPYLSIALPGRMFVAAYVKQGYSKLNLSRGIEEGGTLISPLVPWNAGGAFVITALGLGISEGNVENLLYIPLAFACWLSPLIGLTYAAFGLFSPKISAEELSRYEHDEIQASQEQNDVTKNTDTKNDGNAHER